MLSMLTVQLKTDMLKMSADLNRQYEELKKLIVGNTQQPRVMGNPVQSSIYCFSWSIGCSPAVSKFRQSEIRFGRGKCDDAREATENESVSWIPCMLGLRNPRTHFSISYTARSHMHILPRLPFSYPIIVLRARRRSRD